MLADNCAANAGTPAFSFVWKLFLVAEGRIELPPRVPKTRMLALHHTPEQSSKVSSPMSKVCLAENDFGLSTFVLVAAEGVEPSSLDYRSRALPLSYTAEGSALCFVLCTLISWERRVALPRRE